MIGVPLLKKCFKAKFEKRLLPVKVLQKKLSFFFEPSTAGAESHSVCLRLSVHRTRKMILRLFFFCP